MTTRKFEFGNGDLAKDKITGFKGTVTGTAYYLTGCNQYLLTPKCVKSSEKPVGHWFDEDRMELIKKEAVKAKEVTGDSPGADMPAPGGTREH